MAPSRMRRCVPIFALLSLLAAACGEPRVEGEPDGGTPDAAADASSPDSGEVEPRCYGRGGVDLGPLEPPTDACELSQEEPQNEVAAAACLGYAPFVQDEFDHFADILLGDVTARRFQVEALDPLWPTYRALMEAEESQALEAKVYARVGDAGNTVTLEELDMLAGLDAYTMRALYCLDHPLPADFVDLVESALPQGGYEVTHVLMALFWLHDQGCEDPTSPELLAEVIGLTAALIDDDHEAITDLEVEAAAFLAYLGEGALIPEGFLEGVVAAQLEDGSWGAGPGAPGNGHTSGLALWYLHEVLYPGRATTMVTPCVRDLAED